MPFKLLYMLPIAFASSHDSRRKIMKMGFPSTSLLARTQKGKIEDTSCGLRKAMLMRRTITWHPDNLIA
jgi:hypothetical protein